MRCGAARRERRAAVCMAKGRLRLHPLQCQVLSERLRMMKSGRNMSKTRNWAFVVYPESAPEGWQGLLADTRIKSFISPLHDSDTDDEGTFKKPHYHCIIMADGPITQKRANELIEPFCGTKSAEYIKSLRGYVRYLAHLDCTPDKAQYDPADIVALNGADLAGLLRLNPSENDNHRIIGEIMHYCVETVTYEFAALVQYAVTEHKDWLPVIVNKAYFVSRFLDSLRYSNRR